MTSRLCPKQHQLKHILSKIKGNEVKLEVVPTGSFFVLDELLLDIVVLDYSEVNGNSYPPILTAQKFRFSRSLLTSDKTSKPLVLRLLSETVLPKRYYSDGIESDMVQKIPDLMLRLHRSGRESETVKKIEDTVLKSMHRERNVLAHHMSVHIILYKGCCKYYAINIGEIASKIDLIYLVLLMQSHNLVERSYPSGPEEEEEGCCLECSICLQEIKTANGAAALPCSHVYHHGCVAKWLGRRRTCPLCRCRTSLHSIDVYKVRF